MAKAKVLSSLIGTDLNDKYAEIALGQDGLLQLQVFNDDSSFFDLTSATAITANFRNADNSTLSLALSAGVTIVTALQGKIQIALTAVQTALLYPVVRGPIYLTITVSASKTIVLDGLERAVSVLALPF